MKKQYKKVALVTGSTHGIGKAIILELAKIDCSVIINGATTKILSSDYIAELESIFKDKLEDRILVVRADISKEKQRKKLLEEVRKKFNRIDILVNNAGVSPKIRCDILESTEESYDYVMNTNLKGPFFLTQSVANWMIEIRSKLKEEYNPYIINISSISRYTSSITRAEYCLSKAGVNMMTKLYADRLADHGIFIYEISPGIINTSMTEKVHEKYEKLIHDGLTPIKRWGKPIDIAKPVVAIVSGLIPFSTGSVLDIDGGFHIKRL
ncbi:MAG: 3-ketoacyl-ACP reductase [Promethearchaeota archaeon]